MVNVIFGNIRRLETLQFVISIMEPLVTHMRSIDYELIRGL